MKVIDLLNKIANGEEVPEKIKYSGLDYQFQHNCMDYLTDYGTCFIRNISSKSLNNEIEILDDDYLEEAKKEDLINHLVNDCGCVIEDTPKEDISNLKWSEYVIKKDVKKCSQEDLRTYISLLMETQNEIIDRLKSKGE